MILSQSLSLLLSRVANQAAIIFLGKEVKYRDFVSHVARLSYLLQKEVGIGKRVAYIGSNSAAFLPAFFALTNNRGLFIPMDPNLSDMDLSQWIYDTNPEYFMVTSDQVSRVQDLCRRNNYSMPVVEIEKKRGGEYDNSYQAPSDNLPKDEDPVLLLRTAKTAGKYKYCLFNHVNIQAAVTGIKRQYRLSPSDRVLTTMNWAHPFALLHGALVPILNGSACVVEHGLRGMEFIQFITESKITKLVDNYDFINKLMVLCQMEKQSLKLLKSVTVGLGPINPEIVAAYQGMNNIQVAQCYGQTENLWTVCMSDSYASEDKNSTPPAGMQRGLAGVRYKVLDENGDEIEGKGSREGQLAVSGPTVMMKYDCQRKQEEAPTKILNQNALRGTWLYTGDIFKLEEIDKEFFMSFVRRKDGLQPVVPSEEGLNPSATIETVLKKEEGILEVIAFKAGNEGKSPMVCAIVANEKLQKNPRELLEILKPNLTPKQVPKEIVQIPEIPKDAAGKADLPTLQALYMALLEAKNGKKAA